MHKRILYYFILILLFGIISGHNSLHAQVDPNEGLIQKTVSSPTLPERKLAPTFTMDPGYNKILMDAMALQNIADSLGNLAFRYRQDILFIDDVYERNRIQYHLGILEDHKRSVQAEADSLFNILPGMTITADRSTLLILDTIIEGIKVYHYNTEKSTVTDEFTDKRETVQKLPEETFSILSRSAYSSERPFENNFKIPPGVFYRIQMAVLNKEVDWDQFGGIQPITVDLSDEGGAFKYYAGKFSKYSDAETALGRVRASGFKDAFIVSYYNGQRMSVEQVREYEKEIH